MENLELSVLDKDILRIIEVFRPEIYKEGDQWVCCYGKSRPHGIIGSGKTPMSAAYDFWEKLYKNR